VVRSLLARPRTIRGRITAIAALSVGVALAAGAAGLLLTLHRSLLHDDDARARTRLHDLADAVRVGTLGPIVRASGDDLAQIVALTPTGAPGAVMAATPNLTGHPALTQFTPAGDRPAAVTVRDVPVDSEREDYRVWALRVSTPAGPYVVYVGTNLEPVGETVETVRDLLIVGLPALLALLAAGTWILLGRALHPVEAIRAEVTDISAHALHRRVPQPPTDDEVGRLARTMNMMLERLEAATERQRRFVADASHELRSPLAAFRTNLEVALAHPAATDWRAIAGELLQDSMRMERLVGDLLLLARSDEAAPSPPSVPVDLDDLVLAEAARLRPAAGVRLDTSAVSAAPVLGNPDELARMIRNLLDNAQRHARTAVRAEVGVTDGQVRLTVADDGPGIPTEHRERIFERFARLDEARSRDGGAGLGLAVVADIVRRHRGTVRAEADTTAGALFVVHLPQQPTPEHQPRPRA